LIYRSGFKVAPAACIVPLVVKNLSAARSGIADVVARVDGVSGTVRARSKGKNERKYDKKC